jgi:hypothetical protein
MSKDRLPTIDPIPRNNKARGMDYHEATKEGKEAIASVSMGIFVDMVNAGHTFQEAIASVYYSGMVHAIKLPAYLKEQGLTADV